MSADQWIIMLTGPWTNNISCNFNVVYTNVPLLKVVQSFCIVFKFTNFVLFAALLVSCQKFVLIMFYFLGSD